MKVNLYPRSSHAFAHPHHVRLLSTALTACGDDKETTNNSPAPQDMAAGVDMKASADMAQPKPDQGDDQDMAQPEDMGADMAQPDMPAPMFDAPAEKDALFSWL